MITQPKSTFAKGFRPQQSIPESEKNLDWAKANIDYCIAMCPIGFMHEHPAEDQMRRYNGKRDRKKFEHLTKAFGPEFPINKIKHVPLIRPLLNELQGEYEELGIDFTVFFMDNDSVKMKHELISVNLLDSITQAIKDGEDVDETLDALEKHYKNRFQTNLEKSVWAALTAYVQQNRLEREFVKNFIHKMATGAEYYRVVVNRLGEDPEYTAIQPGHLFYADNRVDSVRDCDWAVYPVEMTPVQILDSFGEYLQEKDRQKLENWTEMYSRDSVKFRDEYHPDRVINSEEELFFARNDQSHLITVYFTEWKSTRRIDYVEMPNKYDPEAPFTKILDDEDLQEFAPGGKYRKRRKFRKVKFYQDRWSGIRIGDDIYAKVGKDKYVTRNPAKPSRCYLTFNGPTYANGIEPYSLIDVTDDIQDTYDILHFHRDNLLALSGVKGSYMDISQMPDFGTGNFTDNIKLFMYYKKLGVAFIDSSQEKAGNYNQFGTYDDTLGQGYAVVLQAIANIEELAGRLVGVNRQRLGQTTYRDGKAVTENAQVQASLITQGMFNEHYEFVRQALEDIAHAYRIAYKNGNVSSYISDEYSQTIFSLEPGWSLSYYGIYIDNKYSEKRTVQEMKSFAMQVMREGMMEFQDIIPLFRKGNLSDVLTHIEHSMTKRKEKIAQQENQLANLEAQLKMAEAQGKVQLIQAQIQKIAEDIQVNRAKLQLEQQALNDDRMKDMLDANNEAQRIALEAKQIDVAAFSRGNASEVRNK